MDAPMLERTKAVGEQDRVVVERIEPRQIPERATEEVLVKADLVISRYRERLQSWEDKGWRIDTEKMNTLKDKKAFAIPSPARRIQKGWALDPVPLIAGKTSGTASRQAAE